MEPIFTPESLRFLAALKKNNRREWFQPRKAEYEEKVHQPMLTLAQLLNEDLERAAPAYAFPDSAKALNRIYRDVRFSSDKTPYQTHVSALFPHQRLGKKSGAAFYVSIAPQEVMIAAGMYFGDTRQLQAVRQHFAEHHARFKKLVGKKAVAEMFGEVQGEQLQKVPRQFGADHPAADLLRHKQWMLWRKWPPEEITKGTFAKQAIETVRLLTPFAEFLNEPLLALPATELTL